MPDDSETIAEMVAPQLSSSMLMMAQANAATPPAMPSLQIMSNGKGDVVGVNRSAKGSMLMNKPVVTQKKYQTLGQFIEDVTDNN